MVEPSYAIKFSKPAYRHLETFRRFDRNRILDNIKKQLIYKPNEETKRIVRILAIGIKGHEKIIIDGEEIIL